MDLRESDELVAFRAEARDWLEAHAPAQGSPEDFTVGRDRAFVEGCRRWQAVEARSVAIARTVRKRVRAFTPR